MNLRRACEHGEWRAHLYMLDGPFDPEKEGDGISALDFEVADCPGGTEPTTEELLAMLVEEGVLRRDDTRLGVYVGGWLKEVTP